jgi:hypothetical protein
MRPEYCSVARRNGAGGNSQLYGLSSPDRRLVNATLVIFIHICLATLRQARYIIHRLPLGRLSPNSLTRLADGQQNQAYSNPVYIFAA